jgi:hypothetical protein
MSDTNYSINETEMPNQIESMLKEIIFDEEELENLKKTEKKKSFDALSNNEDETFENSNFFSPFNFIEFNDNDLFNSTLTDEIFNSTNNSNIEFLRTNEKNKPQTIIMKNPFTIKNNNPFNFYFDDNNRPKSPNSTHKFYMKRALNERNIINNMNEMNSININNNNNTINNLIFFNPNIITGHNYNFPENINFQNIHIDNQQRNNMRNHIRKNRGTIIHGNNDYQKYKNKHLIQNHNSQIRFQTMQIKKSKNLTIQIELYLSELDKYLQLIGYINYNIFNNIKQQLCHLIKTQTGSKILQNYLKNTPPQIIHLLYNEINTKLNILLLDPYANYFCLKLFCFLNENDRISFLSLIVKNISIFSTNKIATYPIQYIVTHLNSKTEMQIIIHQMNKNLMKLALDIYGTHVIEKILISFDKELCNEIFNFITENFIFLSNHVNGLCLVKKILIIQYQNNSYSNLKEIIINKCSELIENPYGNYALQIVIDNWNNNDLFDIFKQFFGHLTELSSMKYASNVIERFIEKNEEFLNEYILEICVKKNTIGTLIKNSFGNYVIQTALKYSKGKFKIILINSIENNINFLNDKKLIHKWKNIISSNLIDDNKINVNEINL